MTYLALIIALLLAFGWGSASRVHRDDWYRSWEGAVGSRDLAPWLGLALAVLLPAALLGVVLDALEPVLFGLLWLGSAVLVLLYSLGRGDYAADLATYRRQCRSGDFEGAFLGGGSAMTSDATGADPATPEEVNDLAQLDLLYRGFERWFPVVFYFMVLGPPAALVYRLLHLSAGGRYAGTAARWLFVADWVPARLLAATFAVTGDFVGCRDALLDALQRGSREAGLLLYRVGAPALGPIPGREGDFGAWAAAQNEAFAGLLKRSAGAWLVVISLYVVFL